MSDKYTLPESALGTLLGAIAASGRRVLGPKKVAGRIEIADIKTPADLARNAQSTVSAKATVFPKVERLLKYRFEGGKNVAVDDIQPNAQPTVLFGIRPCEARAFHALDVVFNWDYKDKFFNARMANTTVVAISCTTADDSCFCTSVGSRPDDTAGSDILLSPLKAGGYLAQVLTDKGKAIVDPGQGRLPAPGRRARPGPRRHRRARLRRQGPRSQARRQVRQPRLGRAEPALPRLRRLRLRLPDLRLLLHRGRSRHPQGRPPADLG